jgi:hypothetical protein
MGEWVGAFTMGRMRLRLKTFESDGPLTIPRFEISGKPLWQNQAFGSQIQRRAA